MKKCISILFLLLLSSLNSIAQTLSNDNFIYTAAPQRAVKAENYNSLARVNLKQNITYFDGLGRPIQSVGIKQGGIDRINDNLLDWKNTWTIGNGSVSFFNQNGDTSENVRINGVGPFTKNAVLWQCVNDAASDADGGWNSATIPVDKTASYRYAVWVKRTGGQDGYTFHGIQNVVNLDGSPNGNPYFWAGTLPDADTWYLMIGMIHPATYSGGYSGISGVYDTTGNKVISGSDFKWTSTTVDAYFRSYLYYATNTNTSQYFYNPTVQKIDGTEASFTGLAADFDASDLVTHIGYDDFGRQDKDYLPYAVQNIGNEHFKTNALIATNNYYTSNYPSEINAVTPNPFSQKQFESSPLNRILKQSTPGNDWALNRTGDDHSIKLDYQTNIAGEVKNYTISLSFADNTYTPTLSLSTLNSGYYDINQLYKTITKDENWITTDGNNKTTVEFKDKEGHIVLKRTYNANISHDTYYVYDSYGNLTYVLPPLVDTNNFIKTKTDAGYYNFTKDFNQSVFSGTSSGGGNVSVKIVNNVLTVVFSAGFSTSMLNTTPQELATTPCLLPDMTLGTISGGNYGVSIIGGKLKLTNLTGASSGGFSTTFTVNLPMACSSIVPADQAALDNLCYQYKYNYRNLLVEKKIPGKQWELIVYDKLDRPILTQDANLKAANKWLFTKYDSFSRPIYTGEYVNAVQITRSDVQTLANASGNIFETKQGVNTINGTNVYYSNNAFPNAANINLLTINYYDDYNFDLNGGASTVSYNITPITNAKGLATGSKVRVLDTSSWITSLSYYDVKGRPIYSYSKNDYLATTSTVKSNLDFPGKLLETTSSHTRASVTTNIVDTFGYDPAGRLLTQKQKINSQLQEIIVSNTYDELGQLIRKGIGGNSDQARLQTVDFKYNIRGWLKNINDVNTIGTDLFAFQINYNDIADVSKKLYNGNISQTFWKTANTDSSLKNYDYTYDALNRLTNATDNLNKFNESLAYDKNGNITNLTRLGEIVGGVPLITNSSDFGVMDNLIYIYDGGNKLQIVSDSANESYGFKDDFIGAGADTSIDYTYDSNGNMITDTNKNIGAIAYNYLNLPTQVTIAGQNIKYVYDATGVKQKKIVNGITTDYAGGFIYEDGNMKFFSQPEGYVTNNSGTFSYIYQYKDHLGNVRLSYNNVSTTNTPSLQIVEENNYYPFGLKHKGYNIGYVSGNGNATAQKYKYNGKELQDELELGFYDYGARNYDPALGRWMNIDPLAEQYRRWTPYNYVMNNPLSFTDPDGMSASPIYDENGKYLGNDNQGFTGEAIFMNRSVFAVLGGYMQDSNGNSNISHETALSYGQTLDQIDLKQGGIDRVNNAITDIVSKADGMSFETSDLLNGKTSSYFATANISTTRGDDYIVKAANNGSPYSLDSPEVPAYTSDNKITYNMSSSLVSGKGQFTVENIQNAAAHEGNGHMVKGISGDGTAHAKAYEIQMKHPTWEGTTPTWKREIQKAYNMIKQGKL